jgi:hypothetical protein
MSGDAQGKTAFTFQKFRLLITGKPRHLSRIYQNEAPEGAFIIGSWFVAYMGSTENCRDYLNRH